MARDLKKFTGQCTHKYFFPSHETGSYDNTFVDTNENTHFPGTEM